MNARFEFQPGVGALAFDGQHCFLDAAEIGLGKRQQFRLPALQAAHSVCTSSEDRPANNDASSPPVPARISTIALELSADILRQQQAVSRRAPGGRTARADVSFLVRRKRFQIRVRLGIGEQGFRLRLAVRALTYRRGWSVPRCQLRMLLRQLDEIASVAALAHLRFDCRKAVEHAFEFGFGNHGSILLISYVMAARETATHVEGRFKPAMTMS